MRNSLRQLALRQANGLAIVVLLCTVAGFAAFLLLARNVDPSSGLASAEFVYSACQVLPYGLMGAVLMARRPDLPFGWLLALAAMSLVLMLVVVGPSYWALDEGHGGELALWGLTFGSLAFVPAALEGLINVRFPSGRPTGRWGRWLDRVLIWGIGVVLVGGLLGDSAIRSIQPDSDADPNRFIDGTPIVDIGNALGFATPLVILLGVLAGIGVVIRCFRSSGLERKQLQWRAAGVVGALALFPFAVAETLPDWASGLAPLLFVVTLAVPVLRYDLWAIDSLIRRSAGYALSSEGSVVENLVRSAAEMLKLPYVAVLRNDVVLASYGEPTDLAQTWPLFHQGEQVALMGAAAPHGLAAIGDRDRQVLATMAQLIAGSVHAEALNADLLTTRHQLVAAREEERRRLRRDLHDGLGPLLTGLGLNLDAARSSIAQDADRAGTYLDRAKDASSQVINDLRGLVYGLRPPALDDLGFIGAVRLHAERIADEGGLALDLRLPREVVLPAAVEVAAFRTVVEAVTNVVRHSGASSVTVTVAPSERDVVVLVTDDGVPAGEWQPGVGLSGMRERAEELAGTFTAGSSPGGGRIEVVFPLRTMTP
ncbi:histidine kinase [Nocardioides sp. WS12]|uniref:sensor histidine kinase n=1 Tax=Nocardioides sp. WS12 TaxID=2486272 RepID=UPI0015FA0AC2|nr:histidine kinase [Nocardioides sp. WS12]